MSGWSSDELNRIGRAEELEVAWRRGDGALSNRVTIWVVRLGDRLFVRSAVKGRGATWYRAVESAREARVWAGGVEKEVRLIDADHAFDGEIDAAYRKKYNRYGARIVNTCLSPEARSTTLELVPR